MQVMLALIMYVLALNVSLLFVSFTKGTEWFTLSVSSVIRNDDVCQRLDYNGNVNVKSSLQRNHNADKIRERCQLLRDKLNSLQHAADQRKAKLIDNSAFLQFIWKTDVVESWIGL